MSKNTQSCWQFRGRKMKFTMAVSLLYLCYYWLISSNVQAVSWNRFTTGVYYTNLKLVTELHYYPTRYFLTGTEIRYARLECSKYCAQNQSCYSFNLYQSDSSYVCELVPDNFCTNRFRKALVDWPGNEIWDKISTGMSKSCLETKYPPPTSIPCSVVRQMCLGTWPNCTNCTKSCKDGYIRTPINNYYDCNFWPEGPLQMPIFGYCYARKTFLIKRIINLLTAKDYAFYQMPFYDMKRMLLLPDITRVEFHFADFGPQHVAWYTNFNLDVNGTLLNLTYRNATPPFDMFNLSNKTSGAIPFVNVTDDRYGCGSFWLLDPSNATYCPGGGVSMLGKLQVKGNQVILTGIRYPTFSASSFLTHATIELC